MNTIFETENVLEAYLSCRYNKRNKGKVLEYEIGYEEKIMKLSEKLKKRKYECGKSVCFTVTHPKPREIFAAEFEDRVVHHLLVGKLEPELEKTFSYSSFACRKEKGTLKASKYLRSRMNKVTKNKTKKAYYGQFDIKSFFMSIDKGKLLEILEEEISKKFKKEQEELMWLCEKIVNHDPTQNYVNNGVFEKIPKHKSLFGVKKGKGLAIGNLTSQFFANVYLNKLDQYVKRNLKAKHYVRYVDDFVILSESFEEIVDMREKISEYLEKELFLELQPSKDKYGSIYGGIDFVGYVVKPSHVLVRDRLVKNLKNKLYFFNQGYFLETKKSKQEYLPMPSPLSKENVSKMLSTINSYYGYLIQGNTFKLRRNLYEKHFGILKKVLEPKEQYMYFGIMNE